MHLYNQKGCTRDKQDGNKSQIWENWVCWTGWGLK